MPDPVNLVDQMLEHDRVLVRAELALATGGFFQPTGFPDIGACVYVDGRGRRRCLVESEQSMANRLESVCMATSGGWREPFVGKLPLVQVQDTKNRLLATNLTEAHRIASSYVLEGTLVAGGGSLQKKLEKFLGLDGKVWPLDGREKLTQAVFALDPAAVLHGFQFMQWEAVGVRQARLVHARLEATLAEPDAGEVHYGMVKVDGIEPGSSAAKKSNKGQSIAHRARYVPTEIEATFEIDVGALKERPLVPAQNGKDGGNAAARRFLLALALWKIQRFLTDAPSYDPRTGQTVHSLRLRADCHLVRGDQLTWQHADGGTKYGDKIALAVDSMVGAAGALLVDPPDFTGLLKATLDLTGLDHTVTYTVKKEATAAPDALPASDDAAPSTE